MVAVESIDSRQYRFGYVANSWEELPADFGECVTRRNFRSALFLPRDDAGWFDRSQYPPRIILLYDDALEIRAHPACGENPAQIPLCELQFLELGHILLQGWLGITAAYCDRRLLYNTRSSPSVRRFLVALRSAFVPPDAKPASKPTNFGRPLDLKFRNAYADELTPGEELAAQFFQPAQLRLRRFGPLKREFWSPADLIAITNRRVMWITDRYRERHEPFGTITRFAPFRAISEYACIPSQGGVNLAVALQSGLDWRVPVSNELEGEARAFVQAAESR